MNSINELQQMSYGLYLAVACLCDDNRPDDRDDAPLSSDDDAPLFSCDAPEPERRCVVLWCDDA